MEEVVGADAAPRASVDGDAAPAEPPAGSKVPVLAEGRRIDHLYCTREDVEVAATGIVGEIEARAEEARAEVTAAFEERIAAMRERQEELLAKIAEVAEAKIKVLQKQVEGMQMGSYPSAPPEDPDQQPDPNAYLLDADAVINFKPGEEDFKEKIKLFGSIDESSTYASHTMVRGPALGVLKVQVPSFLWIYACDRVGLRRKEGGDAITVTFSAPEFFESLEIEDKKDGRYKVSFIPTKEGQFMLHLAVGPDGSAEYLKGSPFPLTVRQPTEYSRIAADAEVEGKARIGLVGEPCVPDPLGHLHHPSGLDFDYSGRFIFVVDQSNHRIQVFDAAGSGHEHQALYAFGKKGFSTRDFDTPCDVVVDDFDRVVVSDLLNHRLQVFQFSPRSVELTHLRSVGGKGTGEGQFEFPKGLGITQHGHLLVCDSGNHRVQVFDMNDDFKFLKEFGKQGVEAGDFTSPLDVAVNFGGEVLVADMCNRIQVFDSEYAFRHSFGVRGHKEGQFKYPTNICVDNENVLYVCDQGNHRMQVLSAVDGSFVHKWGGAKKTPGGEGEGEEPPPAEEEEGGAPPEWLGIRNPAGIAVNADGMVVVSDFHHNTLFVF